VATIKREAWTPADIDALLEMRSVGSSAAEIAWALDRTVAAINTKVHVMGATRRRSSSSSPSRRGRRG
jgi:hypothetical protein